MQGVPLDFARRNGLNKGRRVIALRNQEGKTWESKLKTTRSGQVFICRNWRSFCTASKLKIGDSFQFKLLENTETPVFQLCSLSEVKPKKETLSESEEDNVVDKTETPRFVKITTTASSLEIGKQVRLRNIYVFGFFFSFVMLSLLSESTGTFHESKQAQQAREDSIGRQRQSGVVDET